ncbi:MAG: amidase [Thermomicrobiales bacterium]|nr:amidase [Thermomicrobiales bacterium]
MTEDAHPLAWMDATSLAHRIRTRELSPTDVADATLGRIDRYNGFLNAFCTVTPELAREDARRIENALNSGDPVGPLADVPIAIKDLVLTKGIRTVSGSWAYADFVPSEDDIVVERLKAAGAVNVGKTNVSEFGYAGLGSDPVFGDTRNPWNTAMTTGGSSAGSAAAVARAWCRSLSGATAAARFGLQAASVACTASRRRSAACRSIPGAAMRATRASRAGSRSSTSARCRARSGTAP